MSKPKNQNQKVSKTQLMHILEISYPTACKEYKRIHFVMEIKEKFKRDFLTISDLVSYGIL